MNTQTYNKITGVVFLIVALLHLARLMFGWQVMFSSFVVPMWWSYFGLIIPGTLSYLGFKFSK